MLNKFLPAGTKVICKDANGSSGCLTAGKEYSLCADFSPGSSFVYVRDDLGRTNDWFSRRFEEAVEKTEAQKRNIEVGDRVRRRKDGGPFGSATRFGKVNATGIVTRVRSDGGAIEWKDDVSGFQYQMSSLTIGDFVVVNKKAEIEEAKAKAAEATKSINAWLREVEAMVAPKVRLSYPGLNLQQVAKKPALVGTKATTLIVDELVKDDQVVPAKTGMVMLTLDGRVFGAPMSEAKAKSILGTFPLSHRKRFQAYRLFAASL